MFLLRNTAFAQLKADFALDKSGGCSPLAVSFTNKSAGASARAIYTWDFGNGNSSSLLNPRAIFTVEQTYRVTLSIQDGSNKSSTSKEITVYKNPTADFTPSVSKGCLPLVVNFTANASAGDGQIAGYTWDFGDGSTQQGYDNQQPHTYSVPQIITASLTVTNNYGCHTSIQKTDVLTVIPSLNAGFSADKKVLCLISDPVQFSNTSSGPGTLSYVWDFGDGNSSTQSNPVYSFNKKGIYSVKLTVNSSEGCRASVQQTDLLNVASYQTDFDAPASVCQSTTVNFNSLSTPAPDNSIWEVDGVQIYSYNSLSYWFSSPGTHTIKLDNSFGTCLQSVSKDIVVKPTPVVNAFDAVPTSRCSKVSYQFSDHTPGAVKWEWDFDHRYDPPQIGSTMQSPGFVYSNDIYAYHPVWVRVTNADGCSSSIIQAVEIHGPFVTLETDGPTSSCADPITEHFSTYTNQVLTSYLWDFGDGHTSAEATPTHTFTGVGRYTVTLNYTTQEGCKNSVVNSNYITIAPKPDFDFKASAATVCGRTQILFDATPNDPYMIYWSWDFGDNQPYEPTGPNYFHTYENPGTYSVKLYISGICNATVEKDNYIVVQDLFPKISAFSNTCDGSRGEVSFSQTSNNASSVIWDFGDGTTLSTPPDQHSVNHEYKKTGAYAVVLTASNAQCTQTDRTTVYVLLKQKPVLSASEAIACTSDNVPIQIAGLETNPQPFSYAYPYNVIKLEYPDGTPFDGNRYDTYTGWQNTYNGSVNSFRQSDETFQAIVMSSYFNCTDTSNFVSLKIKGAIPGFEVIADNLCYQSPVVFKDTSKTTGGNPILSWLWDFGDGQTASGKQNQDIYHNYQNPGSHLVTLQITDAGGCTSSTPPYGQRVNVNGPLAAFISSGNLVALNSTIYFYNNSNNYGSPDTKYIWDFGDNTPVSTDFNSVHTYPVAGTYIVTLTAINPDISCSSSATATIVVKDFNTAFGFTTAFVSGTCPPVLVNFNSTSVNYSRITWDFGDGTSAGNLSNPSHIYANPGKYYITLHGYAPNGLEEKHVDSIIIQTPAATVTADPLEMCMGTSFTLSAKATNTSVYLWDFGDGNVGSTDTGSLAHAYLAAGTYHPELMMQDANGCAGKADPVSAVFVRNNPVIHFSPADPLICRGSALSIQASGGSVYVWSPAYGLSNDGIAEPSAFPLVTTNYSVQVIDDYGCKDSAQLKVEVVQPGSIRLNPDTAICAGNPVPLRASGEETYQWIDYTDGLNNTQISDPVALPPATAVYTVTGTDGHHCFTDTVNIRIRVMPLPEVNAGQDVEIWAGETTVLNGTGSSDVQQWTWLPQKYLSCADCPAPVCTALASTNYVLRVKNQDGCMASDTVAIKIDCAAAHVSVPNVFTPNQDGRNDVFMIKGISLIKHLAIFDRWGEIVFERKNFIAGDRSACWNGTFNGMDVPSGSYVYFVEMECPSGGLFTRKGSVVLIR